MAPEHDRGRRVRYRFSPLERRGVIAGWRGGQIASVTCGLLADVVVLRARPSVGGVLFALVGLAAGLAVAFWPIRGRTGEQWLPLVVRWVWSAWTGSRRQLAPSPASGHLATVDTFRRGSGSTEVRPVNAKIRTRGRTVFDGLTVVGTPFDPQSPMAELGMVLDSRARTATAALVVRGHSFALLSSSDQEGRIAAWARVLSSMAREGSKIHRVQWIESCLPDDGGAVRRHLADNAVLGGDSPACCSYRALVDEAAPVTRRHQVLVTLSIRTGRSSRFGRSSGGGRSSDGGRSSGGGRSSDGGRSSSDGRSSDGGRSSSDGRSSDGGRSSWAGRSSQGSTTAIGNVLAREVVSLHRALDGADVSVEGVLGPGALAWEIAAASAALNEIGEQAGPCGSTGHAGPVGSGGHASLSGSTGHAGPVGSAGHAGPVGSGGHAGPSGSAGHAGPVGSGGHAGPSGSAGVVPGRSVGRGGRTAPREERTSHWPWPMAVEPTWDALHTDATWHATYWIAEWPRVDVTPEFLGPLLFSPLRRSISLIMEPISPSRAARQVAQARTADLADGELRRRGGFLTTARHARQKESVEERDVELADGHAQYRFSGYVTVTADSREELTTSRAAAEQAAGQAGVELRLLYGAQDVAFTCSLPLGRGLS